MNGTGIWSKVSYEPADVQENGGEDDGDSWTWRLADLVASIFWIYAVLEVFVTDVAGDVFGSLAHYRYFFFIGVLALLALAIRDRWKILLVYCYIACFPAVVLLWKIPKALYKTGTGVVFLGAVNVLASLLAGFWRTVIVNAVFSFAALLACVNVSKPVTYVAVACLLALLVEGLYRTFRASITPTRFVAAQQRSIRRIFDSQVMDKLITPEASLRRPEIEKFDSVQLKAFTSRLGDAVLVNRGLSYWAYQLEAYRRSSVTVFFNLAAYCWLFIRVLSILTFANWGLYRGDSTAFSFTHAPSFPAMLGNTAAGFYGGGAAGLSPESTAANALGALTLAVGILMLGFLAVSTYLSLRATHEGGEIQDLIAEVRGERARLNSKFRDEYEVSVAEATERLERLKFGMIGLVTAMSKRIPEDFLEDGAPSASARSL